MALQHRDSVRGEAQLPGALLAPEARGSGGERRGLVISNQRSALMATGGVQLLSPQPDWRVGQTDVAALVPKLWADPLIDPLMG